MHVLILNQTFYPDVAATAQHMWDLARYLAGRGHIVRAVCSQNIYGTTRFHGSRYERLGNIHIHRVPGMAMGKRRLRLRLADFLSFYAGALWQLQRLPRPDVILSLTTPPLIGALGVLQRRFRGQGAPRQLRLVQHVMDLYPDAAVAMSVMREGSGLHRLLHRISRRILQSSDAVIVLGRDMHERLIHQYRMGAYTRRIHIVSPWADGSALFPLEKRDNPLARELNLAESFNVVYSGNLGLAHDLDTLVAAIDQTRDDAGMCWVFIGGGNRFNQLQKLAGEKAWRNVRLLPYLERHRLNQSLNLADVHLVSQLPAFTGIVVPSKLYGILAVGKPSVMVGPPEAECSRVIVENRCGFVVANGGASELVGCLRRLRDEPEMRREMGLRARRAFQSQYDWTIACSKIESILQQVVDSP